MEPMLCFKGLTDIVIYKVLKLGCNTMFFKCRLTDIVIYKVLKHSQEPAEREFCLTDIVIYKVLKRNIMLI